MLNYSNAIEQVFGKEAADDAYSAWQWGEKNIDKLTVEVVLDIHRILMIRIDERIAGRIRNCDVWIGGQRKYFASEQLMREEIAEILMMMDIPANKFKTNEYKEEYTIHIHVLFEGIHPFVDGNGRTGRILYNLHRLKLGLPIHTIHPGKEQMAYYMWFRDKDDVEFLKRLYKSFDSK